ncbi:Actin-binding Rho-activating protein MS1 [Triplophysa tibetana]|uniref:Actin-binding Rho-activating protein MS1 n=1 Tax=Triplophysa tibetana TaxID=1572043 RepID=A0A5A9N4T7_9TELE|nr:Actin-binding Rho-activating protein MS1 [Triplophysa tibetana]
METDDAPAHCARSGNDSSETCTLSVKGLTENWQKWSDDHCESQKQNPFSNGKVTPGQIQRGQEGYGRPLEGSKTEQRGKDAHSRISGEVTELCQVIRDNGTRGEDGRTAVRFDALFERYVTISDKLVGVLLRARRQGLVHFEGEMLWQGRDDGVLITLLQ